MVPGRAFQANRPERIYYGRGRVSMLSREVDYAGAQRAFLVTGRSLARNTPLVGRVTRLIGLRSAAIFAGSRQHVPLWSVDAALDAAREADADLLVSLGGGTAIDTTKAVALCLALGVSSSEEALEALRGGVLDSRGFGARGLAVGRSGDRVVPHIAIPTTLAGAEYSSGFSVTDDAGTKHSYVASMLMPNAVILDPEVTLYTPERLWLSTGVRAIDHAVESLCSLQRTPVTDALAAAALPRLFRALPTSRARPEDLELRLECQLAAWLAIYLAIGNVRMGLSHGLGRLLGGRFGVPHGITSCILLPQVLRYNLPVNAERQEQLAEWLHAAGVSGGADGVATALAEAVAGLVDELGLPARLREVAVPWEGLSELAEQAVREGAGAGNARPIESGREIEELLRSAW